MTVEGEQLFDHQDKGYLNRPVGLAPKVMNITHNVVLTFILFLFR